jgi:hypothetical protein
VQPRFETLKRYGDHQQDEVLETAREPVAKREKPPRIRCPLCGWEPDGYPYWGCNQWIDGRSCATIWNTFATRARCPTCSHQYKETWCPRCNRMSLHEAWYEQSEED